MNSDADVKTYGNRTCLINLQGFSYKIFIITLLCIHI